MTKHFTELTVILVLLPFLLGATTTATTKQCYQDIQAAKQTSKGTICTQQIQQLYCPHGNVKYTAGDGCQISYLKQHGWKTTLTMCSTPTCPGNVNPIQVGTKPNGCPRYTCNESTSCEIPGCVQGATLIRTGKKPNGCPRYKCAGGGPDTQPVNKSETNNVTLPHCTGCLHNGDCIPVGTRVETKTPRYCSDTRGLVPQKKHREKCQRNYQCRSNTCNNGNCVLKQSQQSLLQRLLSLLPFV